MPITNAMGRNPKPVTVAKPNLTERTRRKPLWFQPRRSGGFLKDFSQNTGADMHREQKHSSPFCA
jgi:hypothetical protein